MMLRLETDTDHPACVVILNGMLYVWRDRSQWHFLTLTRRASGLTQRFGVTCKCPYRAAKIQSKTDILDLAVDVDFKTQKR